MSRRRFRPAAGDIDPRPLPREDLRDVDVRERRDAETLAFERAMRTSVTVDLDVEMRYRERRALGDRPTFGVGEE